jgi:hypothetical protein
MYHTNVTHPRDRLEPDRESSSRDSERRRIAQDGTNRSMLPRRGRAPAESIPDPSIGRRKREVGGEVNRNVGNVHTVDHLGSMHRMREGKVEMRSRMVPTKTGRAPRSEGVDSIRETRRKREVSNYSRERAQGRRPPVDQVGDPVMERRSAPSWESREFASGNSRPSTAVSLRTERPQKKRKAGVSNPAPERMKGLRTGGRGLEPRMERADAGDASLESFIVGPAYERNFGTIRGPSMNGTKVREAIHDLPDELAPGSNKRPSTVMDDPKVCNRTVEIRV